MCCSVLQSVAVCCSVLQCVAAYLLLVEVVEANEKLLHKMLDVSLA